MGSKTERWAGTKMQRVILLKRPTFLLYDGVESLPCAILLKIYKLQFPVSIKSSFQDKRNKTVAVLFSSWIKVTMMLLQYLFFTGKATVLLYSKFQTWVGKEPPLTAAGSRGSRIVWSTLAGCFTDTMPQQWGYNTAGISDETVSKGCQWQSIKAS